MNRIRQFTRVFALLGALLLLASCASPALPVVTPAPTEQATSAPTATAVPTETPTVLPETPTPDMTPTSTAQLTPSPLITPSPTPKTPKMYASYADLISFDPETGIAKFDFFDMLRGDEAVEFLVEQEGYTKAAAEDMVDNFAESEFVKKNLNPQLRAIDIDDVPLKLMIKPSGDPVDDAEPKTVTAAQFRAIYALDTSLLLESYFYYIHVDDDGKVTLVEQVYWP